MRVAIGLQHCVEIRFQTYAPLSHLKCLRIPTAQGPHIGISHAEGPSALAAHTFLKDTSNAISDWRSWLRVS